MALGSFTYSHLGSQMTVDESMKSFLKNKMDFVVFVVRHFRAFGPLFHIESFRTSLMIFNLERVWKIKLIVLKSEMKLCILNHWLGNKLNLDRVIQSFSCFDLMCHVSRAEEKHTFLTYFCATTKNQGE